MCRECVLRPWSALLSATYQRWALLGFLYVLLLQSIAPEAEYAIGTWGAGIVCVAAAVVCQVLVGAMGTRPRGGAWAGLLALGWATEYVNRMPRWGVGLPSGRVAIDLSFLFGSQGPTFLVRGLFGLGWPVIPWSVLVLILDGIDAWLSVSEENGFGVRDVGVVLVGDVVAAAVCARGYMLT